MKVLFKSRKRTLLFVLTICISSIVLAALPKVALKEYVYNGNTFLGVTVGGADYVIRGVCYQPVAQGMTYTDWSTVDRDILLMKEANINTIRVYAPIEKTEVLNKFAMAGIRIIMGIGYGDPAQKYKMADNSYQQYINLYKNHPAILFWEFGNEYNYHYDQWFGKTTAKEGALVWYDALEKAAQWTHLNAPNQLVSTAHGNNPNAWGDIPAPLDYCPSVDVWGMNVYNHTGSAGEMFAFWGQHVKDGKKLKATYLSESGADSWRTITNTPVAPNYWVWYESGSEDEAMQEKCNRLILNDVYAQNALNYPSTTEYLGYGGRHVGIGITLFQLTDGWHKGANGSPNTQDPAEGFPGGTPEDGYANEEYWGITKIDGTKKASFASVANIYNQVKSWAPDIAIDPALIPSIGPELSRIEISPATATVALNEALPFQLKGYDQDGKPFTITEKIVWKTTGSTLSNTGLFTSTEQYIVTATIGTLKSTAVVTVNRDINTSLLNIDSKNQTISAYPNPTSGKVSILLHDKHANYISIYDMMGKMVEGKPLNQDTQMIDIDLNNYKSGVYIIKLTTENNTLITKVIKQ